MPWTFRPDEHVPPSRLIQQTRAGLLIGTGVRRSDDRFVVLEAHGIPYAYVVFDRECGRVVLRLLSELEHRGIYSDW